MAEPNPNPAQGTPTPDQLQDAAIKAVETWQATPNDELKKAAQDAVNKAKEAYKNLPKAKEVPEKYDIKIPDGVKVDAKYLEGVAAFAKERGLSNEDAQAILAREQSLVSSISQQQSEIVKKEQDSWEEAVKNDGELGGSKFKEVVTLAGRVVSRFGSEELKKLLNDTRYGSHPEWVRMMYRIGQSMSDDQLVLPENKNAPPAEKSQADIMYPKK